MCDNAFPPSAKRAKTSPCVLTFCFMHETHTFSKMKADRRAFESGVLGGLWQGNDVLTRLKGKNTETAGFIDVAEAQGWELVPTVAAFANPCGKVTREAFEFARDELLAGLKSVHGRLDGVLLALHGAMVAEHVDDGEGEFLRTVRGAIGEGVPILVTLDLHANVSDEMVRLADALISYRTYPHIDLRDRGVEAARLLTRVLAKEVQPRVVLERAPMLHGVDMGRTDAGPNIDYQAKARAAEPGGKSAIPGVLNVSINAGFPHADVPFVGPSVTVTYDLCVDGACEAAKLLCRSLMMQQWEDRMIQTNTFLTSEMAIETACEQLSRNGHDKGPIVIADFTDNPGAGTYGDATNLLKALLDSSIENAAFASICDPDAANKLVQAGIGARVNELLVGGKMDPSFGGPSLSLSGIVVAVSETGRFTYWGPMFTGVESSFGPCAVLRIRNRVDIMIATNLVQILDVGMLVESVDLDPREKHIVCVKSMQHFRGAYSPIASDILIADTGALATLDFSGRFVFEKARRPIFPLDKTTVHM